MDLFENIKEIMPRMSKGQKKIADFIMGNFDKAVFMTAAKLGKITGVSESTVVRFASMLGFDGYPEFQKAMTEYASKRLLSIDKIDISSNVAKKQPILEKVLISDIEKIKLTLDILDNDTFESAINIINSSKKIYICGLRNCMALAEILGFYLRNIYENIVVISTNSFSEILEQTIRINEKDCFIGISFPRYSMRTLKAMEFANHKNAKVIAITDSKSSPMCLYSSCNLIAKSEMTNTFDSLTAPLSLINAIVVALSVKNNDKVLKNLNEVERVWEDYQIYSVDEINKL
ncbi:MAG: MurR/RpiR family transcriptional regulator [Lachnospiraceae bacterium]|nr:MurR/RpiR family transcriptional regulator [Lachnospiraceae bacterium]